MIFLFFFTLLMHTMHSGEKPEKRLHCTVKTKDLNNLKMAQRVKCYQTITRGMNELQECSMYCETLLNLTNSVQ